MAVQEFTGACELRLLFLELVLQLTYTLLQLLIAATQLRAFLNDVFDAGTDLAHLDFDIGDMPPLLLKVGDHPSVVLHFLGVLVVQLIDQMQKELVLVVALVGLLLQLLLVEDVH